MFIYKLLDVFFLVFHTLLILFILSGWIWKRTRKLNLFTILLTAASWVVLGIFYGFGYCPLTDWHFSILEKLGHGDLPDSYIKYLADRISEQDLSQRLIDRVTLTGLIVAMGCSLFVNVGSVLKKPFPHRRDTHPEG
jgi:hypothetical protein